MGVGGYAALRTLGVALGVGAMATTVLPRAAAVVLLREATASPTAFEIYMLRRLERARFAPGAYVFPGGVLEEGDRAVAATLPGTVDDSAIAALHARMAGTGPFASPDELTSASLLVCAARELFEEVGVLPARDAAGSPVTMADREHWRGLREELLVGRRTFDRLLANEQLSLSPDDLVYFSHWITPEASPIRFDTHFFLATLPAGQIPSPSEDEASGGLWIAPWEGLARHARGDFPMLSVQWEHLERFGRFDSLAALLAFARRKAVRAVLPTGARPGGEITAMTVALPEEIERCW